MVSHVDTSLSLSYSIFNIIYYGNHSSFLQYFSLYCLFSRLLRYGAILSILMSLLRQEEHKTNHNLCRCEVSMRWIFTSVMRCGLILHLKCELLSECEIGRRYRCEHVDGTCLIVLILLYLPILLYQSNWNDTIRRWLCFDRKIYIYKIYDNRINCMLINQNRTTIHLHCYWEVK